MQETIEQREQRVITRTLDGFAENYKDSSTDSERVKTDSYAREFLDFLVPGNFEKYWDHYEKSKES
jgi:hypothetical protein